MKAVSVRSFIVGFVQLALLLCAASLVSAQALRSGNPARLGFDTERLALLDQNLQGYVDRGQIAGSVTMVLRDGRIVYSEAKGMQDLEGGVPMREDSLFRIASQTKAIVSTGIMMLHERGKLQISDPLSKFLPEWANAQVAVEDGAGGYTLEPVRRPITLRDLLTHTSGIGYGLSGVANQAWVDAGISGWYFSSRNEPIRETVRRMAALPQRAHPGEQWIYGYNIDILGAVIEVVSGKPLNQFLQEEIFAPLGMQDTFFYVPASKASRLSKVYMRPEGGSLQARPERDGMQSQGRFADGPQVSFSGGAGLVSTAENYARFLQMTLNGGSFNGVRLLSPKTVELMTTNHLGDIGFQPGAGMGLGFSVLEDLGRRGTLGSVGEYGWGGAYHSTYWVDPEERLVVVYLTQIIPAVNLDDFNVLRSGIYGALVD